MTARGLENHQNARRMLWEVEGDAGARSSKALLSVKCEE